MHEDCHEPNDDRNAKKMEQNKRSNPLLGEAWNLHPNDSDVWRRILYIVYATARVLHNIFIHIFFIFFFNLIFNVRFNIFLFQ